MKTGGKLSGRLNVPLLRRAAACCLLLAAVTAVANVGGLVFVIGESVLPGWAVSATLLVASLALLLISRRAAGGAGRTRRKGLILLHRLAVFAVGVSSLAGALGDLSATYHLLEPAGPNGCRAVAREYSFLFAGSGQVYAVGPSGIGSRVSSWTADDGYEPIAGGSFSLRWDSGSGSLALMGGMDPVWPRAHEVRCG